VAFMVGTRRGGWRESRRGRWRRNRGAAGTKADHLDALIANESLFNLRRESLTSEDHATNLLAGSAMVVEQLLRPRGLCRPPYPRRNEIRSATIGRRARGTELGRRMAPILMSSCGCLSESCVGSRARDGGRVSGLDVQPTGAGPRAYRASHSAGQHQVSETRAHFFAAVAEAMRRKYWSA